MKNDLQNVIQERIYLAKLDLCSICNFMVEFSLFLISFNSVWSFCFTLKQKIMSILIVPRQAHLVSQELRIQLENDK